MWVPSWHGKKNGLTKFQLYFNKLHGMGDTVVKIRMCE